MTLEGFWVAQGLLKFPDSQASRGLRSPEFVEEVFEEILVAVGFCEEALPVDEFLVPEIEIAGRELFPLRV